MIWVRNKEAKFLTFAKYKGFRFYKEVGWKRKVISK